MSERRDYGEPAAGPSTPNFLPGPPSLVRRAHVQIVRGDGGRIAVQGIRATEASQFYSPPARPVSAMRAFALRTADGDGSIVLDRIISK